MCFAGVAVVKLLQVLPISVITKEIGNINFKEGGVKSLNALSDKIGWLIMGLTLGL